MTRNKAFETGVALVIGGGGGVGGAVARALAADGADVVLTYRSSHAAAEATAEAVRALGRSARCLALDLTDHAAVADLVAEVEGTAGAIHTVIYAAGPMLPFKFL